MAEPRSCTGPTQKLEFGTIPEGGWTLTPYILLVRKKLPRERPPSPDYVYDELRQLWIDKKSGTPLVSRMRTYAQSQFGETTLTETREGADQTEGAALQVSQFGETIKTMTREGIDQTEGSTIQASQLGETTLTKTQEGRGSDRANGPSPI